MQKYLVHKIIAILVFSLLGLSSSNPSEQISKRVETLATLEEIIKADVSDYRLGPGDVITINVDFVPEISKTYTISDIGNITFSTLLSPLKIQDLTVEDTQALLVEVLTVFMYEPRVTVSIMEYHSHKVLLLGPFQTPGNRILKKEKMSLLDIITEAGGLREIKDNDELIILRSPSSSNPSKNNPENDDPSTLMQSIRINLQKLLRDGDLTQNIAIQSGDVIYISSFFAAEHYVYVSGSGSRGAGAIPYEKGLTAYKALMRAGITPDDPQAFEIFIIRSQAEGDQFITTKLKFDPANPGIGDIELKPEDIVILPSATTQVVYVAGEVNRPGTLPYKEGLTVLQAVLDAGGMSKKAVGNKSRILREDPNGRTQIPVDMNVILEKGDKTQNITLLSGDIIVIPGMTLQEDLMVTGKVNTPGMVPYEEGITLMKVIFMSGGLSNNALKSEIRIMKKNGEVQPAFTFDVSKAQAGESGNYNPNIDPGDLVVVLGTAPGDIISVLGKVQKPGIIEYEEGLTVLQAILKSGGFGQGAARSKVKIIRGDGDKQKNLQADLDNLMDKNNRSRDIQLLPGDIVIVPETFF